MAARRGCASAWRLHIGELLYGNIGGGNRLDFTSIGPAVNLAARLEKLSAELRRSVLVSADFAKYCQSGLTPLGDFAHKGFALRSGAFGLPEEQPDSPSNRGA